MRSIYITFCVLTATLCQAQNLYFPPTNSNIWETTSATSLGYCPEGIDSLYQFLEDEQTFSFLLLKDGKIVLERYFGTYTADSINVWYSAGKSFTALLTGIAQDEGFLDIEDKTSDYLGRGWTSLSRSKEDLIKVRNQLSMTSGLEELTFLCTLPSCLTYRADAGTRWVYHNGPYTLLTDVVEAATGLDYDAFSNTRVEQPIGMNGFWARGLFTHFYYSNARDMARFGLLFLNEGQWDNTPILGDPNYFNDMVNSSQNLNPAYGYLWWLNGKSSYISTGSPNSVDGTLYPNAPADMYSAIGLDGQHISVVPSKGWVMVRQGDFSANGRVDFDLLDEIWKRIVALETPMECRNAITFSDCYLNDALPLQTFEAQTTIVSSGNVQIESGKTIDFTAGEAIVLKDGFEVLNGSDFSTTINPTLDCTPPLANNPVEQTSLAIPSSSDSSLQSFSSSVYPNPSQAIINLQIESDQAQPIQVYLTDISGKQQLLYEEWMEVGQQQLEFNLQQLQKGTYILNIRTGSESRFHKVVLH
ncbi:MAG: serine hydrolase [Bacteroidota bacterium]